MPDSPPRRVAVIVLTWNAVEYTRRCLELLRQNTAHPDWRLIVVDNGSTDGTVDYLRRLDDVTVIENPTNLGFTAGNNIGLRATEADEDVVLLNNDIMIHDLGWLGELQRIAHDDERNGLVGCRLVDADGEINHIGSYVCPRSLKGEQLGGNEIDINQATGIHAVEAIIFAAVYIRRDCLDKVGLLDEDYIAYLEDSDWCLRATVAGYRVMYAGNVTLIHHHNTSTRVNNVDIWSMIVRSRKVFERKWARYLEGERYVTEAVFRGVLRQPLSMAVTAKQIMTAMHFAGVKTYYENAYGEVDPPAPDPLLADLQQRTPTSETTRIAYCNAFNFPGTPGRRRIGWTMLEVTGLPRDWVDGCNQMDEIWVPSSFNVETFRRAGVTVPIHTVPLGVDPNYMHPGISSYRPSDHYTFLAWFEWGERKDPEKLLTAYAEEFGRGDDVVLIASIFNRDPTVDVHREIAKLDLPAAAPIVVILNPDFVDYQKGALYRSADCYVSATHGEGWGMHQLEAMACGLPVISTGWSAPTEFMTADNSYPVGYSMIPAVARCPYYEGWEWADADAGELRALMRHVYEHSDEARAKGAKAALDVAQRWTWQATAERIRERLLA